MGSIRQPKCVSCQPRVCWAALGRSRYERRFLARTRCLRRPMARAGTVAVLLPGAFYFIRETKRPPVELLRARSVNMALATDCNPGSSPLTSLLLATNMGATLFRMTVAECLAGVTREAARALGVLRATGTLDTAKYCDLSVWDIDRPAELVYRIGFNPLYGRVWRGR